MTNTADEWLADPHAAPWLRSVLGTGPLAARLADPQRGQLMRAIPLSRLARFPGFPLDDTQIADAVERFGSTPNGRLGDRCRAGIVAPSRRLRRRRNPKAAGRFRAGGFRHGQGR